MATTYAHENDTIIVGGIEHTLVASEDVSQVGMIGATYVLIPHPRCVACGENEIEHAGLCEWCITRALHVIGVGELIEQITRMPVIGEAIDVLQRYDECMARHSAPYIDSIASARDALHDESAIRNAMDELIPLMNNARNLL